MLPAKWKSLESTPPGALLGANEPHEDDVYQADWSRREQISH
jgi:hypothetical protein